MAYNDRIRELREDHDLTQTHVAKILGTEQSYYAKYESGKHPLPIHHLITLCNLYKVSADYILGLNKGLRWPREEKAQHRLDLTKYDFLLRVFGHLFRIAFLKQEGKPCTGPSNTHFPDILGATHLGCPLSLQTASHEGLPKIVIETRLVAGAKAPAKRTATNIINYIGQPF